jgi:hypothetical protein
MPKYKYFAALGEDGLPRACHYVAGLEPDGALEITAEQAAAISADLRARNAVEAAPLVSQSFVTRDEAAAMATAAAEAAVAAYAERLAKMAGG